MQIESPREPRSTAHVAVRPVPDVSVVIANWNAKGCLLDALRSIEEDDGSVSVEIIVVDNGSSDGSSEAVRDEFPRVTVICNRTNLGFARATNIGIARAVGRYVCLMNSDALVRPATLGRLVRFMDARPGVGLAGPRVLNPDGSLHPTCRRFPGLRSSLSRAFAIHRLFPESSWFGGEMMTCWPHDAERSVDVVIGCFCVARCEAVRDVGLLDERFFLYSEDVDWCMRFHAAGWDVRFYPGAEAVHVRAASSSAAPERFVVELQRASLQLYRKHYNGPAFTAMVALAFIYHVVRLVARLTLYLFRPSHRQSLKAKIGEHTACLRWMLHL